MPSDDRMPPYNEQAERGVIGSLLLDNRTADDVLVLVNDGDFYVPELATLFRTIRKLIENGDPATGISVWDALAARGLANETYDAALSSALSSVPHAANASYYARIVHQKAQARRLAEVCEETLAEVYAYQDTADALLDRAEGRILEIRSDRAGITDCPALEPLGLSLARAWRRKAGEPDEGISTGLDIADSFIGGMRPGQLIVLAARPSIGKTALALNIAANAAFEGGRRVLFVSLEMGQLEITDRLICSRCQIPGAMLKAGQLSQKDENRVARLVDDAGCERMRIDDAPMQTVARVAATARRHKRGDGLDMIVVDYLQLLTPPADVPRRASQQEQVTAISFRLKGMARELQVPVLAISQLNRQAEARADKRPQLADLRTSGAIEQDADIVMLLHRPEFYDATDSPGVAELNIAKNRSGQTGIVKLCFRKDITLFSDLDESHVEF